VPPERFAALGDVAIEAATEVAVVMGSVAAAARNP
jgi:hypothetical protein